MKYLSLLFLPLCALVGLILGVGLVKLAKNEALKNCEMIIKKENK